jgi:nucleotide-binding universal stress UspA family protein
VDTGVFDEIEKGARERLKTVVPEETAKGIDVRLALRRGAAFVEIVRYARDEGVDLITIATHGRTGLRHALFGSVAEKVVRKAPCPVLSVRPREHEFSLP